MLKNKNAFALFVKRLGKIINRNLLKVFGSLFFGGG